MTGEALPALPERAGEGGGDWQPPSHLDVVRYLGAYSRALEAATSEAADLGTAFAEAKASYRVAYARAFLSGEGTVKDREQHAVLETAGDLLAMETAEQKLKASRERIHTLRTQIDTGRSLGAAIRTEMGLAGVVGP